MICIICAMSEERDAFISIMKDLKKSRGKKIMYHGVPLDNLYYTGKIAGNDVAIIHCGVGKVYAAIVTSEAIRKFKPDLIINVGCAGSLNNEVHVGDVVVADRVADWDVDVPGWPRNIISEKLSHTCDGHVIKTVKSIKSNIKVHVGNIVSADEFIYKKSQTNVIKKYFPGALCGEMEGSSVATTCYAYGVNFAIIRSISDEALVNGDFKNFDFNLKKACKNAAKLCTEIIKRY